MVVSCLLRNIADGPLLCIGSSIHRWVDCKFSDWISQSRRFGASAYHTNLLVCGTAYWKLCRRFTRSFVEQAHARAYQFECAISCEGFRFRAPAGLVVVVASAGEHG